MAYPTNAAAAVPTVAAMIVDGRMEDAMAKKMGDENYTRYEGAGAGIETNAGGGQGKASGLYDGESEAREDFGNRVTSFAKPCPVDSRSTVHTAHHTPDNPGSAPAECRPSCNNGRLGEERLLVAQEGAQVQGSTSDAQDLSAAAAPETTSLVWFSKLRQRAFGATSSPRVPGSNRQFD